MSRKYFAVNFGTREWFREAAVREIDVANSPPNKEPKMQGMREGDPVLILTFGKRTFIGEFAFKEAMEVHYEKFERDYKQQNRVLETSHAPFPAPGDKCWIMVFDNVKSYRKEVSEKDIYDIPDLNKSQIHHIFKRIRGFSPLKREGYWEIREKIKEVGGF